MELILGNCLDKLKELKDDSVDFVITSPPYNMNLRIRGGKYCSRQIVKEFSSKYDGFSDNLKMDEYFKFHSDVIKEMLRVCKKYIFYIIQPITGNKRALWKLIGEYSNNLKELIIWNKINGQPAMAEKVLNSVFEMILVFSKQKDDAISRQFKNCGFKRGTLDNIWNIKKNKSIDKSHSATFPEELIDKIILNFTLENDIILDPFMGTGTTGVCCIKNKRDFIGIELIGKYFEISKERLNI